MNREEFISLIGEDVVVDYPFGNELQRWSMKNFYVGHDGRIYHNRIYTLNVEVFLIHARNPHKGEPTHG